MIHLSKILSVFAEDPRSAVAALAVTALIAVNGLTDTPVNIAAAVGSRAMTLKGAAAASAVANLFGALLSAVFTGGVGASVLGFADFRSECVLQAVAAVVISVVLWSLSASAAGLPTSESHAMLAALSGSSAAIFGIGAISPAEWLKVAIGLLLSCLPVAFGAFIASFLLERTQKHCRISFKKLQVFGVFLSSFAHGAQDGQKFAALLALIFLDSDGRVEVSAVPLEFSVASGVILALGTLAVGKRILLRLESAVPVSPAAGFASELASSLCLLFLSVLGIPAATTAAKTSAVLGAGVFANKKLPQRSTTVSYLAVWLLTLPVCFILGLVLTMLLMKI